MDFKTLRVIRERSGIRVGSLDPQIWGNGFSYSAQTPKDPGTFRRDIENPWVAERYLVLIMSTHS